MAMGAINKPDLYQAVLAAALAKVERGAVPDRLLLPNDLKIFRAVSPAHVPVASDVATRTNFVSLSAVQECLKVRDQCTDKNRFTGRAADGKCGPTGGVYFFLSQAAGLAEMLHYAEKDVVEAVASNDFDKMMPFDVASRRVSTAYLMARTGILVANLTKPKLVADVSLHNQSRSGEVRRFLNEIGKDPNVSKLIGGKNLPDLMLDETDYSVARAIGHAIQGSGRFDGMIAETARATERRGETGSNLVLFGKDGAVSGGVEVETALYFFAPGVVAQEQIMKAKVATRF